MQSLEKVYNEKIYIYEGINEWLLPYIPDGSTVLDVGCGTGRLGEYLKIHKNCRVYGIDISSHAVELAATRIEDAVAMDIEAMEFPYKELKFDVIILGDVLEHLKNPTEILKLYAQYLYENGVFVVSIPNVANIIIRLKLLWGRWDYRSAGIMDATHLRFFTFKTMVAMFNEANLFIKKSSYIPGKYFLRLQHLTPVTKMETILNRLRPTLFAIQFVFQLGKK